MTHHSDISLTCRQAVCVLLEELQAGNCLIIGTDDSAQFTSCQAGTAIPVACATQYRDATLSQISDYDFVLLLNLLERLPRASAEHIIASLRDLYGGCFAVVFDPQHVDNWRSQDLLALGLYQLPLAEQAEQIFLFDIHTYKQTPDWLNSRYWAHPELFDKYRW